MNAIRQIVSPSNGRIVIDIPNEYKQKLFEVIVLPVEDIVDNEQIKQKVAQFLQTLPAIEPALSEADIMAEIKAVRTARYGR